MKTKSKNTSKSAVVHYHKDTELIHDTLIKGSAYTTSKGHGVYTGRSQSNGKLVFKSTDDGITNIYFTKKEWEEGGNSSKSIDKEYIKKVAADTLEKVKAVASSLGLVPGKSILMDIKNDSFGGNEATYLELNPLYGLKVRYKDSGSTVVYYSGSEFKDRFDIIERGTPDPVKASAPVKKSKKRKK